MLRSFLKPSWLLDNVAKMSFSNSDRKQECYRSGLGWWVVLCKRWVSPKFSCRNSTGPLQILHRCLGSILSGLKAFDVWVALSPGIFVDAPQFMFLDRTRKSTLNMMLMVVLIALVEVAPSLIVPPFDSNEFTKHITWKLRWRTWGELSWRIFSLL